MLVVPRIHTKLARRAFSVAAPSTWNSLPADIRLCKTILTFKRHLKTHLFKLTYPPVLHHAPLYLRTYSVKALYKYVIIIIIIYTLSEA